MSSIPSKIPVLRILDEVPLSRYHWKIVGVTGLGFFTDAYDLFVISTVSAILQRLWGLTDFQTALLNSAALLSAATGALLFGYLLDKVGRRAMYGYETLILAVGALLSSLSPNYGWLLASRVLLGFGVGGDYPASAVIVSEFANRPNRGRLVTVVFSMQGVGLIAGPTISLIILSMGVSPELAWRVLLGLGAIPAALGFILRRGMSESPRFILQTRQKHYGANALHEILRHVSPGETIAAAADPEHSAEGWVASAGRLTRAPFIQRLVGTSLAWFLIDVIFYGNGVSYHLILNWVFQKATLIDTLVISLVLFSIFAMPGYVLAASTMDRLGRRFIQGLGFFVIAAASAAVFTIPEITRVPLLFTLLYGVSYFFVEFGPNTTTFLLPSEVFPTHLRGTAHGIASAMGKFGAFSAALWFPTVVERFGLTGLFGLIAGLSVIGAAATGWLLPEPRMRALEEMNAALSSDEVHHKYGRILDSMTNDRFESTLVDEMSALSGSSAVTLYELDASGQKAELVSLKAAELPLLEVFDSLRELTLTEELPNRIFRDAVHHRRPEVWSSARPQKSQRSRALGSIQSFAVFPVARDRECTEILAFWDTAEGTFTRERIVQLEAFVQLIAKLIDRRSEFTRLNRLAQTDPLTGLANRLGLELEIEKRMQEGADAGSRLAFFALDLDRFKRLNDTLGHQSGDMALREIARALQDGHQSGAFFAARLGGDEFVLLYPIDGPVPLSERMETLVARLPLQKWGLGLSAGVAFYPEDGSSYQELYRVADSRLYKAKQSGGARIAYRDADFGEVVGDDPQAVAEAGGENGPHAGGARPRDPEPAR